MAMMDEKDISTGFRALFYMVTPNESSFERVEDVPPYTSQVGLPPPPPAVRTGQEVRLVTMLHPRQPCHVTGALQVNLRAQLSQ